MTLTGLKPGDDWSDSDEQLLLTPHVLLQTQFPCTYEIRDSLFQWFLVWNVLDTGASVIRISDNASVFQQGDAPPCVLEVSNFNFEPTGVAAFDGIATIQFGTKDIK